MYCRSYCHFREKDENNGFPFCKSLSSALTSHIFALFHWGFRDRQKCSCSWLDSWQSFLCRENLDVTLPNWRCRSNFHIGFQMIFVIAQYKRLIFNILNILAFLYIWCIRINRHMTSIVFLSDLHNKLSINNYKNKHKSEHKNLIYVYVWKLDI